jgi:hypothetical protein
VKCPACGSTLRVPDAALDDLQAAEILDDDDADDNTSGQTYRLGQASASTGDSPDAAAGGAVPSPFPRVRTKRNVFQPHLGPAEVEPDSLPAKDSGRRKKRKGRRPRRTSTGSALPPTWATSLLFPAQRECLLTITVMTVIYSVIVGPLRFIGYAPIWLSPKGILGVLMISVIVLGYFWHLLFQILRAASQNEPDMPISNDWDLEAITYDLFLAVGCHLMSFLPLVIYGTLVAATDLVFSPVILMVLLAGSMLYLPMALLAGAMHQSALAAGPWLVVPAMMRTPLAYLETCLLVLGVLGVSALLHTAAGYVPYLGGLVSWFVTFYGNAAIMHRLGAMYYLHRRTLDWFPDQPRIEV